jgi:DNA-binding NtrC family response regulator
VRELKNLVHRAYILADNELSPEDIPAEVTAERVGAYGHAIGGSAPNGGTLSVRVGSTVADMERQLIEATLIFCGGNKQKAAEVLGVSLKTLYNRLAAYRVHGA